jgi:predicted PurR-regulated permease PerM
MSDPRVKSLGRPVLYFLILLGIYLTYLILKPFFAALTWAVIFAIMFRGMQTRLSARMGKGRAAVVTTLIVAAVIVAPAAVLISALTREVPQITEQLKETTESAPSQIQRVWDTVRRRSPVALPEDPMTFMREGAQRGLSGAPRRRVRRRLLRWELWCRCCSPCSSCFATATRSAFKARPAVLGTGKRTADG